MKQYIPFTQQPYLCVPTCVQMVMFRRGIPLLEQEVIGNELGLIVPEKDVNLFANARTGEKPIAGWGTQIQLPEYSMQAFFDRHNINLVISVESKFNTVEDLRNRLRVIADDDTIDALLCFNYGQLWGTDSNGGHVCVFDKLEGDDVWLIDPERNVPKRRKVTIAKLFDAIKVHGAENAAGIWMVSMSVRA